MGGILDSQVHMAVEATYGTYTVPTRSFEVTQDPASSRRMYLEAVGMRAGLQGPRTDRRRKINVGAEGTLSPVVLENGFGMLLRGISGVSTIAQQGATTAYLQTHSTTAHAPDVSYVVQVGRPPVEPTDAVQPYTYLGGAVTEASFSCEPGDGDAGLLKCELSMDYATESQAQALAAGVYPVAQHPYGWDDMLVKIDGSAIDVRSANLTIPFERATERYHLRRNTAKKKPIRSGTPRPTGEMTADYELAANLYNHVKNGSTHTLVYEWQSPLLAGVGHNFYFRITSKVQFINGSPETQIDDLPEQPLEFVVLHDGTDPMIKFEYMSTDTAY